jgi:hypothetical protein
MTPDKRERLRMLLAELDEAVRGMHAADEAVGDGNDSLRSMLDAQSRAIAAHGVVIKAMLESNRIVQELLDDPDS